MTARRRGRRPEAGERRVPGCRLPLRPQRRDAHALRLREGVAFARGGRIVERCGEAVALDSLVDGRWCDASEVAQCLSIEVAHLSHACVDLTVGLGQPRRGDDQWHAQRVLPRCHFGPRVVLSEVLAVISGEENQRILRLVDLV